MSRKQFLQFDTAKVGSFDGVGKERLLKTFNMV